MYGTGAKAADQVAKNPAIILRSTDETSSGLVQKSGIHCLPAKCELMLTSGLRVEKARFSIRKPHLYQVKPQEHCFV